MVKLKRVEIGGEADRRNREHLARLAQEVRRSRRRRRHTQAQLGSAVGLSRSTISALERGQGASHTLDTWQRIGVALGRPVEVRLAPDALAEPADAGHLAIQELVLRVTRTAGYHGSFELPTRPAEPWRSVDVGPRDDRRRRLLLIEYWNAVVDVGAAARMTARKQAEAEQLAAAFGGDAPYAVSCCWVMRATRRNRELVARFPAVLSSRFPGSSKRWIEALTDGAEPPSEPGLVWCDLRATGIYPWRRVSP